MVSSNPLKACADLSACSGGVQRKVSEFGSVARANHLTNCVPGINRSAERTVLVSVLLSHSICPARPRSPCLPA